MILKKTSIYSGFFMRKLLVFLTSILLLSSILIVSGCDGCSSCRKEEKRTQYGITCTLEGENITVTQAVNFYNSYDNSFKELKFNLFANAFRKDAKYSPVSSQHYSQAYYKGMSYGFTEIISVFHAQTPLEFSICGEDQNILLVNLSEEVFPGESYSLTIEYAVQIPTANARLGICKNTINLANFYPILCEYDNDGFYECLYYANGDPFYSHPADYIVSLTADEKYTVASSGKICSETVSGGKKTTVSKISNARSFAMVLSDKFERKTVTVGQTEINYYYHNDSNPEQSLGFAKESFEQFSTDFGAYPYESYAVVQTGFFQGGMEYPGLVMISDSLEEGAYGEVIVHETAHQWWQGVVGNNEVEYGFLDEGLAEYSVVLFFEKHPEYGFNREQLIKSSEQTYRVFCSVSDQVFHKVNTVMIRGLGEFSSEYEYVIMAYVKPCIMYDYLRTTIGDERFYTALKRYYKEYAFKNALPDDLVGVFEKCGADTNGFFKSFFEGKVVI